MDVEQPQSEPVPTPVAVLYRDEHLVVVYKPAGLLVHRSEIDRHETRFLVQELRDQLQQRVYTVHRLDKPTAGVMVFALSREIAANLSEQFQRRQVTKTYQAIVRGHVPSHTTINYAFVQRYDAMDAATHDRQKTVEAVTHLECLELYELPDAVGRYPTARYAHIGLTPTTGAKHQLRRHLKHIFHPIVGDTTYGDSRHNRFFRSSMQSNRLMLCATRLAFDHPVTAERLDVVTESDAGFQKVLHTLDQRNLYSQITGTQLDSELINAYQRTRYVIYPHDDDCENVITLTLNERVRLPAYRPTVDGRVEPGPSSSPNLNLNPGNGVAAFLTAHNPESVRLPEETNRALHQQLVDELSDCRINWLPAVAQPCDSNWPQEEGVYLPVIDTTELSRLGHKYKQNAVVVIRSDGRPRLMLLR